MDDFIVSLHISSIVFTAEDGQTAVAEARYIILTHAPTNTVVKSWSADGEDGTTLQDLIAAAVEWAAQPR